ncbi:Acyl-CoA dehydrogenase, N-terminal domain [Novosphingobium sp. CF614]|uniref:acyl-CoA dehydrogenase family protein n=1 Tax=Novosphingobium sp. CF614 TaxID=1884364 RepID=UPI0008F04122|nr:acyl-CoA dehydrogenase family protein [Novosphingobium sp. CF614]SFG26709.1 Acyl-CoA dehydrogenase, N-terminal domain [Novosphingobium sp. CF614]
MIRDAEILDALLASIGRFVDEALIPREKEVAETDAIPADVIEQMKALGLFGLTIPCASRWSASSSGAPSRSSS